MRLGAVVVGIFFAFALAAQDIDGDGYVTMLLPIALSPQHSVPGGYGSEWSGQAWIYNSGINPYLVQHPSTCAPPCGEALRPREFVNDRTFASNGGYGALLNIPSEFEDDFHISARLLERSRQAQPTGVDIPIVSEADFLRADAWILGIPAGEGIRSTLRVFAITRMGPAPLRAEFYDADGKLVSSVILNPAADPNLPPEGNAFDNYAGIDAIVDLTASYSELLEESSFHIRLVPSVPGASYWGFVSVTHNETQHVLFVTPRR